MTRSLPTVIGITQGDSVRSPTVREGAGLGLIQKVPGRGLVMMFFADLHPNGRVSDLSVSPKSQ